MGKYNESLKSSLQANKLRVEMGHRRGIVSTYDLIANIHSEMGNYKTSLEYFKLAKAHSDTLLNEKKNKRIAELQEHFDLENRNKEILLLQKENTIQKNLQKYFVVIILLLLVTAITIYLAYRSKRKLNIILEDRNNKITEQKLELQNVNQKLEGLIATKDKFFSIIAHDLKSPFQGLIGLIEVIQEDRNILSEYEINDHLRLVKDSADGVYELLENLLEWANIQRGHIEFVPASINLKKIADDVINNYNTYAQNKQIRVHNNIRHNIIVKADKNMLSAILRNLISNAIKFSEKEGIIELNANSNSNKIKVYVKDSGIGIPKVMIPKLFSVGEKTSRPGTENEKSTGLGLILCKEYIDKHNGSIWVESEEGKGTAFHFELESR